MPRPTIKRCPTCGRRQRRSSEQNRRYWALMHEISEGIKPEGKQYSTEVWHEYFKQRYIGADEIELPNGKTLVRPHSSAELDMSKGTDEQPSFNEYMERVEAWAAQHGVYLQD